MQTACAFVACLATDEQHIVGLFAGQKRTRRAILPSTASAALTGFDCVGNRAELLDWQQQITLTNGCSAHRLSASCQAWLGVVRHAAAAKP